MSQDFAAARAESASARRALLEALRTRAATPAGRVVSHSRTDRAADGAMRRREYLWRKTVAALTAALAGLASAVLGLITLAAIVQMSAMLSGLSSLIVTILVLPIYGALGLLSFRSAVWCRESIERSRVLRYVPPVHEQIAALPADAILVRASGVPAAVPSELLRAARSEQYAPDDELLRTELH